jgi:hypothetical protein
MATVDIDMEIVKTFGHECNICEKVHTKDIIIGGDNKSVTCFKKKLTKPVILRECDKCNDFSIKKDLINIGGKYLCSKCDKNTRYECIICTGRNYKNGTTLFESCDHFSCNECYDHRQITIKKGELVHDNQFKCHMCRKFIKKACDSNKLMKTFIEENPEGVASGYAARSCARCSIIFTERTSCGDDPNAISSHCDKCLVISVAAKECPKCEYKIIKAGGCDHMTCGKCGTGWCWGCQYIFRDIGEGDNKKYLQSILCILRSNGWSCRNNCTDDWVQSVLWGP